MRSCDPFLPFPSLSLCVRNVHILWNMVINDAIILVRPRWTVEPTDKQFAQGSDVKIDCKADGFPKPEITWKKAVGM